MKKSGISIYISATDLWNNGIMKAVNDLLDLLPRNTISPSTSSLLARSNKVASIKHRGTDTVPWFEVEKLMVLDARRFLVALREKGVISRDEALSLTNGDSFRLRGALTSITKQAGKFGLALPFQKTGDKFIWRTVDDFKNRVD